MDRHAAARIDRGPAGRHGGVGGQAACRPSGCAEGGGAHLRAAGSERLVLSAAAASSQRQEEPILHGGIRVSGLDFEFPCPYGALESYLTKDGCRVMTRDPGDDLWAQTFDWLAPEPSLAHLNADTKGDFLELTLARLRSWIEPCSEPLMRCLHAARLLIEDAARTLEKLQLWGNPLLLRVTREIDGRRVSCKKSPRRVRNWKQACPMFSGPARVSSELETGMSLFFPSCPRGVPRKVPRGGRPVRNCGQLYQASLKKNDT